MTSQPKWPWAPWPRRSTEDQAGLQNVLSPLKKQGELSQQGDANGSPLQPGKRGARGWLSSRADSGCQPSAQGNEEGRGEAVP